MADLRQFISLLKVVGLLNLVISHQIRGNLSQSITHFFKGVIWQSHSCKLKKGKYATISLISYNLI